MLVSPLTRAWVTKTLPDPSGRIPPRLSSSLIQLISRRVPRNGGGHGEVNLGSDEGGVGEVKNMVQNLERWSTI